MSELEATVATPKTDELLTIRITENNLSELARHFDGVILQRVEGRLAISWYGAYGYPGETIVFSAHSSIIGIYTDEELEKLFNLTGEKRPLRRPWPTADLIIIHDGYERGKCSRIEPGTIALRDNEGDYYTREYGLLLQGMDRISRWTPIDPHKETS